MQKLPLITLILVALFFLAGCLSSPEEKKCDTNCIKLQCSTTDTIIPILVKLESNLNTTFISCNIINEDSEPKTVIFSAEIPDWSNKYAETFTIPPNDYVNKNISLTYKDKFFANSELADASISFNVESGGKLFASETKKVKIAPKEDLVGSIIQNGQEIPVPYAVLAWVTPHDACISSLLSIGKELTPGRSLQGYAGYEKLTDEEKRQTTNGQAKAIYDAIKGQKISYVNTPVSFTEGTQHVKLPASALAEKSGNCIDGTLLFMSAFEALGMDTIIVYTPGHASMGVESFPVSNEYIFIETTLVGTSSYEDAIKAGQDLHDKYKNSKDMEIIKTSDYRKLIQPFPSSVSCNLQTTCEDSTKVGECSKEKPKLCIGGQLIEKASVCGCPSGYYAYQDTCVNGKVNDETIVLKKDYYQAFGGSGDNNITTYRYVISSSQPLDVQVVPTYEDYQALYNAESYSSYQNCQAFSVLKYNKSCTYPQNGYFVIHNTGDYDAQIHMEIFFEYQ